MVGGNDEDKCLGGTNCDDVMIQPGATSRHDYIMKIGFFQAKRVPIEEVVTLVPVSFFVILPA